MSFSTISFMIGFIVLKNSEKNATHNWYFFLLCCFCSLWSLSCAIMGLTSNIEYAIYMRSLTIVSILVIHNITIKLIGIWLHIKPMIKKTISILILTLSILIFPIIVAKENVIFVKTSYGFYYKYNGITDSRWLFNGYLIFWGISILILIIPCIRQCDHKRQKFMAHIVLVCLALNVIGSIEDIILPMTGHTVFPASPIIQFIGIILVYMVTIFYNVTQITIKNVSEYIYRVVEVPIVVISEDEKIEIANTSASSFFEIANDQLVGSNFFSLFVIPSKELENYKKGSGTGFKLEGECIINSARCSLSISRIYDRYHELIGDIVVITDLTDKLELIDELNQRKDKAIQAMEAKSAFLANISHEIRTPMNAIIGMTEIILKRNVPIEFKDELHSIFAASKGLLAIINDVLDLSKIESGHFEIVERAYLLDELVCDVVSLISIRLVEHPVYLFVEIQPEIPKKLIGDEVRIKQILVNILGNAVKFTKSGFIKLVIRMEEREQNLIVLHMSVQDTGIGIKKKDINLVFKMFSQVDTKKNRNLSGTGLGLAITRDLVEKMGGVIQVESTYGEGTTFSWSLCQKVRKLDIIGYMDEEKPSFVIYEEEQMVTQYFTRILTMLNIDFTLIRSTEKIGNVSKDIYFIVRKRFYYKIRKLLNIPDQRLILIMDIGESKSSDFIRSHQIFLSLFELQLLDIINCRDEKEIQEHSNYEDISLQKLSNTRILIVDDNITNIQVVKGLLAPYLMMIDHALNGREAIKMVQKREYQLIFMDHMMPEMDGVETLNCIRGLPDYYYKNIPIVALSANVVGDAKSYFMKMGYSDFLAKPIEFSCLEQVIRRFLYGKEKKQELSFTEKEIEGVDLKTASKVFGSNQFVYKEILQTYYDDLSIRRAKLPEIISNKDYFLFTIYVHAIKSASKSIGANLLSAKAEFLEELGLKHQIAENLSVVEAFYQEIDQLLINLHKYFHEEQSNFQSSEHEYR